MKKSLLTIIVTLSFYSFFFAQEEYPFVKEGAVWSEFHFSISISDVNNKYAILGDTLIQDTLFQKVYRWQNDSTLNINQAEKKLYGYVREKNKVVTFIRQYENIIGNIDTLYDTNWEIGDSIGFFYDDIGVKNRVFILEKDSILIHNEYRIQSHFHYNYTLILDSIVYTDTNFLFSYIDGIGSTKELFLTPRSPEVFFSSQRVTCYHEADEFFYMNPDFSTCYIPLTNIKAPYPLHHFEISPNPATNSFFIKNKNATLKKTSIQLIDFQGITVFKKEKQIHKNESFEIKTDHLASGIYFLKINHNNTFTIKKIIINH